MFDDKFFYFKIDCALSFSWNKGKAYARERSFDALSFRIKGNANYYHKNNSYHVGTNDILFVPAHYDYVIDSQCSEEVLVVHFHIENSSFSEMKTFKPSKPDVFNRLFSKMCNVWNSKPIGYEYKLSALFYSILEEIEIQTKQNEASPKLQEALDFIQKNFSLPEINIETVAEHIGVSTVYLRRLFNKNLNITPIKYLNKLRIEYATELLKTGYYSIEEVATLSGFNDAKYFSLLYKKSVGCPPSKKLTKAFYSKV